VVGGEVYATMVWLTTPCSTSRPVKLRRIFAFGVLACWLWFGAGCASVPNTDFLKHTYATRNAEFKTAWGPIPQQTSAAVVAELKRKAGNLDILDRQIAIEQAVVGHPLVLGNKVTLLLDGPATYAAMLAAIHAARSTINLESYIIDDGRMGQVFAEALLERSAAGVEVNVIYDSLGAFKTDKEFFERLRRGGIRVVEFNPVNPFAAKKRWAINHRDHRKLLVVDGRTAFLGGINIDDVYSSGSSSSGGGSSSGGFSSGGSGSSSGGKDKERRSGWRDTDIQIDGPVVADFQKLFLTTWEKQHGPPLAQDKYFTVVPPQGNAIVRAIGSTPDDPYSAIYLTLMAAITNAQREIYITNAYFVPDPQLVAALIDAAKRGVDVRLILPSTTDSRSAAYAAHSHYTELLQGGVKIYERRAALLHAKTAVIDGVWSCVGSSNLDWRSAVDNDEVNAIVLGREFAETMRAAYALDQAQSDMIDLEHWRHRPLRDRVKEWFFHLFGRLL
jgi:cardiolipin synthase